MTRMRVAVIGTGRIGLCLALNLEQSGHDVLGVDTDHSRIREIRERTLRTTEPGVEDALRAATALYLDDDLRSLTEFAPAIVFIAVATPTTAEGGYDASRVDAVIQSLCAMAPPAERVELVLVSTVIPGYCDSTAGMADDHRYALSYSPAFVAQGRILRDLTYPAQVLIGEADPLAGERIQQLYATLHRSQPSIHRMSRLSAEIAKLATNSFLTMKIAFANAVGDLARCAGADAQDVLEAVAADPRIGRALMAYGFGYGGPCLPRDNRALNSFARQHGYELRQGEATDAMNERHLAFQLDETLRAYPADAPIPVHSLSYKPDTDMLEDSQPLALAVALARSGRRVVVHERATVVAKLQARFPGLFEYAAPVSAGADRYRVGGEGV